MARSNLQRRDALKIARKLGATVDSNGKHKRAIFRYNGKVILTFGIRHGSKSGHGHLVGERGDLKLNAKRVEGLAECNMKKKEYIKHLIGIGLIDPVT